MENLQRSTKVVVPTDKTNSTRTLEIDDYTAQVEGHLRKSATLCPWAKLEPIHQNSLELLEAMAGVMDEREPNFVLQMIWKTHM